MADFLLSVGVDVGLSYDQMQKDISNLVSQLNSNPPKIKVGLELDTAAIANFRTQVAEISKSLGGLGHVTSTSATASSASTAAASMADLAAKTRDAASAASAKASAIKADNAEEIKRQSLLKKSYTLLTQMQNAENKWTASKNGKTSTSYTAIQSDIASLQQWTLQFKNGQITAEQFQQKLSSLSSSFTTNSNTIKAAGEATQTWGSRLGALSAKFGTWFSITRVIMAAYRAVRQMVTNVIELDTAMTELKKVTNETDATYEKFLINATHRAKELGAALSDTVSATADFARLGYGIEDAEKLADAAIVYKNVGDGIEDIGTASESIIATMQAFGIPAEQVMSIVDRFNEVGNNFAISSKGVGDALLRSAAALHSANNTLDESIALAAAANTIVQDPDKVGTTLKTVSMYLRAAKTEAEEAGEATDGMANSMSELREDILALTGNKVDIQLDENTFKSTYQILKELSGVWHELTDISQANILEMVGGKRNSNVVSALLENFSVAEKAITTSANSAGSALAENEKVLESIQGKLNIMKATFETLSQNFIGSDLVKFVVDMGTGMMEVINGILKVVDALGGLKTVLIAVSAALLISKGGLIAYKVALLGVAAVEKIVTFFTGLKNGILNIINIIPNAITAWQAYAAGIVSANTAIQASIPVIGLVLAAISAVVAGISMASGSMDNTKKSIEELNNEWDELADKVQGTAQSFQSVRDRADEIIPRYAQLAQGVDRYGNNVSLTSAEFDEFVSLNNELGEMFPDLVAGYDANGNAILSLSGNVDTLTESLYACVEAQRLAAAQEIADTMPDVVKNIKETNDAYEEQIDKLEEKKEQLKDFYEYVTSGGKPQMIKRQGDYYAGLDEGERSQYYDDLGVTRTKYEQKTKLPTTNANKGKGYKVETKFKYTYDPDTIQANYETADMVIDRQIKAIEEKIAAKNKQLNPVVSAWLQTDFLYQDLDQAGQEMVTRLTKSIDFHAEGLDTAEKVQEYISKYIINPIYDMDEESRKAFNGLFDIEEAAANGEITAKAYADKVLEIINGLNVDDKTKTAIKIAFDVDDEGIPAKINHVKGLLNDEFDHLAEGLTVDELEIAYTIVAANGSMTFKQLRAEIDSVQAEMMKAPINSWDDLANSFDAFTSKMQGLSTIQEAVKNGFIISADAAREFAKTYPEILQYATAAGNGQIKLNADVVTNFLNGKTAELKGAIDAQITQLEADKAVLEAKKSAAEAQLELAKQVGEGEGQISADVAAYRIDCGNVMTQALIDQGIDEATAFKLAAAAMAGNVDEFNRIAAEVCTDVDGNFDEAAYSAAQAIYNNMHNAKLSVSAFAKQCHEAAKAMAGVAGGDVQGSSDIQGGGAGGTTNGDIKITLHDGKFEGSEYSYEAKEFSLDEYISNLELDISNYTSKIAEIDGQIAVLQALRNKPLEQFNPDYGKDKGSDKDKEKEVEEYIASVERYTEALQKLRDAEVKQAKLERDLENADTALEKVGIQKDLIEAYKERQQALHELNNLRDTTIKNAIPELQALGFEIEYNADTNRLLITNLEHLNELEAESAGEYENVQEATNALRKDTEELIDDITGLNEENQKGSETWLDLADAINEGKDNIVELLNEAVTEAVDFVSAMQDVYTTLKEAAGEYAETGALSVDTLKAIAEYGAEYMNYLKDENGMLSINKERIEAVIAARTKQLAVDTAMSYVEKIRYALSENNIKELNRLITATEQASDATWSLVYSNLALLDLDDSQYAQALENINRLRSLANNAVESIKLGTDESNKGYEDMQDALDKILDLTMELVEYEVNQEIEALEKQKDKYREIIDLKKEALDETKKENDYNKEVAKKVAEIAKLQDKINKLSLDDSREAQAEKAALEQELAELQTDLSDYQTDYSVDKQQEMLDEMADSYEEEKDKEIAILEDSISSTEKIYQLAIDRINDDWDNLYDDIIDWNYEAGSSIESEIVAAWELASKAVQEYGSYIEATNKLAAGATSDSVDLGASGNYGDPRAIINQMRNNSLQWFTASDAEQSRLSSANKTLASQLSSIYEQDVTSKDGAWYLDGETDPLYSIGKWEAVDFITKAMKNNSAKWSGASPSERAELEKANEKMAKYIADLSGQKVWKDSDGVWWIDNAKLYESYGTYHTGGVVGDSTLKKDEVMAILKDGELVLDEKREEGLYKLVDFAQILSERLGTTIDTSKFDNLFGGFSLLPTSRDLLPAAHAGSTLTEFNPHIEVNISHNGSMSDDDARRYGGLIAETALGELKDAFTKKGITNIGSSALK